jgi:hypothetical protein
MALTDAEKKKLLERFNALTPDEQAALREASWPDELVKDMKNILAKWSNGEPPPPTPKKDDPPKGILERLFGD